MFVTQLIRYSAWKSADPRVRSAETVPIIATLHSGSLLVVPIGQSTTARNDEHRVAAYSHAPKLHDTLKALVIVELFG
jgi:hypothetical protein